MGPLWWGKQFCFLIKERKLKFSWLTILFVYLTSLINATCTIISLAWGILHYCIVKNLGEKIWRITTIRQLFCQFSCICNMRYMQQRELCFYLFHVRIEVRISILQYSNPLRPKLFFKATNHWNIIHNETL